MSCWIGHKMMQVIKVIKCEIHGCVEMDGGNKPSPFEVKHVNWKWMMVLVR